MGAILVLTTAPDAKTARSLARSLVRQRLAACVTVQKSGVSFYRWKGKLERVGESLLIIKTKREKFAGVKNHIQAKHPYELPEIISIPVVQGSREYLSWLNQNVR